MAIKFDTFKTSAASASDVTSVNGEQGDVIVTLDSATDQGATTTNSITVGGLSVGTAYSLPTADGSSGQAIVSDGSGNLSFTTIDPTGALEYKGSFNATAGTPSLADAKQGDYYKIGTAGTIYGQTWAVGDSLLINADMGGTITNSKIDKIDNTDTPASETVAGVIEIATNAEATTGTATDKALVPSNISSIALSSFNDDLSYLSSGDNVSELNNDAGYLTSVASASETVAGVIEIATNAEATTGTATDKALVPSNISSIALSSFNDDLSYLSSGDNVSELNNDAGYLTSVASASETVAGVIEIATNAEATTGTATDKALVPSNISSIALSSFNDDLSYLSSGDNVSELNNDAGYLTDITNESLNDLSDVSFTAGAGINGHVLTYDNTAGWQAVAPASGGLSAVVQDTTPQLGGDLDVNGQQITSASNGNVVINPDGTGVISIGADVVPDADATHTIGSESNRYISTYSDLNGAIRFKAKNDEGGQITKGQAVYIKGLAGDGTTPTVGLADADDASKMPAFGLAFNTANNSAEVQVVQVGNLTGLDTSGFTRGDTLYIGTTAGALVNTKPTGETSQLQNIGRVIRSDNADGVIMVGGAGRSAATPNLDENKIFLGNASNQSVSTALSSIALSSFNDDLSYLSSGDNVSELTNDAGYLTSVASASETVAGVIEIATNAEATTGTATDKALVPSNISSIALSSFNDDLSYLSSGDNVSLLNNDAGYLTGITGESIEDLSDVTITSAANGQVLSYNGTNWVNSASSAGSLSGLSDVTITSAANGEVLKYNGTAWVDAQLAYSELSGTPTNVSTFTNDANYVASGDNVSLLTNDAGYLTSVASASETVAGVIEIATNAEATAGTATNKALVPSNISSIALSSFNDDLSYLSSGDNVSELTNDAGYITSVTSASETVAGVIEIATNAEATAGTATDKALVPSNISSIALSSFNDDLSYLSSGDNVSLLTNDAGYLTGITGESIEDLSDVTITSAANGQVLSYNGSAWVNSVPSAPKTPLTSASPSSDYTISSTSGSERAYILTPSADINVNLPSASTAGSGFKYIIKNMSSAYILTVDANSTETIDGTQTYDINVQYQSLTIISDGTNWLII